MDAHESVARRLYALDDITGYSVTPSLLIVTVLGDADLPRSAEDIAEGAGWERDRGDTFDAEYCPFENRTTYLFRPA